MAQKTAPWKTSLPGSVCFVIAMASHLATHQIVKSLGGGISTTTTAGVAVHSQEYGILPMEYLRSKKDADVNVVPRNMQLAFNQSFGFFDTIADSNWVAHYQTHARQQLARSSSSSPTNDTVSSGLFTNVSQWLYENMDPIFTCPHPQKVGNPAGKWMCDPERWVRHLARRRRQERQTQKEKGLPRTPYESNEPTCLVYSIGSKGNFRWEEDLVDIWGRDDLCEFHIFDPNPAYASSETLARHRRLHWHYHAWGLRGTQSAKNYTRRRDRFFFDLATIRRRLGHEDRPIDIFKIDCEGCEWESMMDWLFDDNYDGSRTRATMDFPDLHHILLETHSLPFPNKPRWAGNFGRFLPMPQVAYLERAFAQRGFVLYAKEVNTHQGLGRSVEWGFIRLAPEFFA